MNRFRSLATSGAWQGKGLPDWAKEEAGQRCCEGKPTAWSPSLVLMVKTRSSEAMQYFRENLTLDDKFHSNWQNAKRFLQVQKVLLHMGLYSGLLDSFACAEVSHANGTLPRSFPQAHRRLVPRQQGLEMPRRPP